MSRVLTSLAGVTLFVFAFLFFLRFVLTLFPFMGVCNYVGDADTMVECFNEMFVFYGSGLGSLIDVDIRF